MIILMLLIQCTKEQFC